MAVIEDKLVGMRLARQPEFLLRLHEFVHLYRIAEQPALVVQARPAGAAVRAVDTGDHEVRQRFAAGVPSNSAWWHGFRGVAEVAPTFHGIASVRPVDKPTWTSELHRDGHFIAGVWKFPELPTGQGKSALVIADFYVQVFLDFFAVVARTLRPNGQVITYEATATLVNARGLHYAGPSEWGGQHVIRAAPLDMDHLQWPTAAAEVGGDQWELVARGMGEALRGAYFQA